MWWLDDVEPYFAATNMLIRNKWNLSLRTQGIQFYVHAHNFVVL